MKFCAKVVKIDRTVKSQRANVEKMLVFSILSADAEQ